jgi:hypothetical protein
VAFNRPEIAYNSADWDRQMEWMVQELCDTWKRLANYKTPIEELRMLQGRASMLTQMLEWPNLPAAGQPQNQRS